MMKLKNSLRNRPINSYLSSISKRIEKKSYRDAAEMTLLLIRNFGLEKELFSFIENKLNGLLHEDHYRFVKELMNQIEVSELIIKEFMKDDHREPLNRFTNFLTEYFLEKAQKYKNQKPSETLKCLEVALELRSVDVEISKSITEIKEKYSQQIKTTELYDKGGGYFDKKVTEIKITLIFERLCTANKLKEWEGVIKLSREMEALDYSEEVHPIKDKVRKAKLHLFNKKLCEAYKNEKWGDVIQFGGEMSALDYDENEFPIIDKVSFSLYVMGAGWLQESEFEKAEQAFLNAIAIKPEFPEALRELGMTYFNMNRIDDAEPFLTEAARHLPKDVNVRFFLGKIYYDKHEYRQAEYFLRAASQLEPKNAATLQFLAKAYFLQRKFEKAKAEYIKILELVPKSKGVLMDLGHLCLHMGDYQSAESYLVEVKNMDPNNYIILNNLSVAKFSLGKLKEAKDLIEEAKETNVVSAEVYCNLATFFWQGNDIINAQKYIEEAYRLNKKNPVIKKNRKIMVKNQKGELTLIAIS